MYSPWTCWPCRIAEFVSLRYGQGNCLELCPTDGYISTIRPEWYPHLQITSSYAQVFELDQDKVRADILANITDLPTHAVEFSSTNPTFDHHIDAPHTIFVGDATTPPSSPIQVPLTKTYVSYTSEPGNNVWFWPAVVLLLLQGIYQNIAEVYDQPEFWTNAYSILFEKLGYVLFPIVVAGVFLTCILPIAALLYLCHHISSKRSKSPESPFALMWPDISNGLPLEYIHFKIEEDDAARKEMEAAKQELAEAMSRKEDNDATQLREKDALQNELDAARREMSEAGLRKKENDARQLEDRKAFQKELEVAQHEFSQAKTQKKDSDAIQLQKNEALQKELEVAQEKLSGADNREEEQARQLEDSKNTTSTIQNRLDRVLRRIAELEDQVKMADGDKQGLQIQVRFAQHEAKQTRDTHEAEIASLKTRHQTSYKDLETVHRSDLFDLRTEHESQRAAAIENLKLVYEQEIEELNSAHEQKLEGMYSEKDLDAQLEEHIKDYEIEITSHKTQLIFRDEAHKREIASFNGSHDTEMHKLVDFYEGLMKKEKEDREAHITQKQTAPQIEMNSLRKAHEAQLIEMQAARQIEISRLRETHELQLNEKKAADEIDSLGRSHESEMMKLVDFYEDMMKHEKESHEAQLKKKKAAHEIEMNSLREAHEEQFKRQEAHDQAERSKLIEYHQVEINMLLEAKDIPLYLDQVEDDTAEWIDEALAKAEADLPAVTRGDQPGSGEVPQTEDHLDSLLSSTSYTPVPWLKPVVVPPYSILTDMDNTSVLSLESTEIVGIRNGAILVDHDSHRDQKDLQPSNYRRMANRVMKTRADMRRNARDRLGMVEIPVTDPSGKVVDHAYQKKPDFPEGRRRRASITCGDLDITLTEKVEWNFAGRKVVPPKSRWDFLLSSEEMLSKARMSADDFEEEVHLREMFAKEDSIPREQQRGFTDKFFAVKASSNSGLVLESKATLTDVLSIDDTRQQQVDWGRGEAAYDIMHGLEMDKTRSTWSKQDARDVHTCMEVRVAAIDKLNGQKLQEFKANEAALAAGEPLPFPPNWPSNGSSLRAALNPGAAPYIPGVHIPTAPRAMREQQPRVWGGQPPPVGNSGLHPAFTPLGPPPPPSMQGAFIPNVNVYTMDFSAPQPRDDDAPMPPSNPVRSDLGRSVWGGYGGATRFHRGGGFNSGYGGYGGYGGRGGYGVRRYWEVCSLKGAEIATGKEEHGRYLGSREGRSRTACLCETT